MDRVSSRHEGDLSGRLAPFAASRPARVVLSIPSQVAGEAACQHAAWMLVNLLARAEGIVELVTIDCPAGVPLAGRIVPLADRGLELADALAAGAASIGVVPVELTSSVPSSAVRFVVGPGEPQPDSIRVHGERWWGGISTGSVPGACDSDLPFGPYVAACLAGAEVFKAVRVPNYSRVVAAYYSLASFRSFGEAPRERIDVGPAVLEGARVRAIMAGLGAVGSAWIHAMWATTGVHGEAVLADADELGVDLTNLNRCAIFGRSSLGKPKASEAANVCHDAPLSWQPHDGTVNDVTDRPPMMLSAVDTNASRQAIQSLYPARLISASTQNMRAELLRCDPTAQTACIHCHNPVPEGPSDNKLKRQFLSMPPEEQSRLADELSFSMDEAHSWARDGACGLVGDRIAAHLRPSEAGAAAFAVGFVSVMAGTMLAAQTIFEAVGQGPLRGLACRAVMQFLDPTAESNRVALYARHPHCGMCDPDAPAAAIWVRRFEEYAG